jgi:hypothetical protein
MKDEESSPHRASFGLLHGIKALLHQVNLGLYEGSPEQFARRPVESAGIRIPIWLGVQAYRKTDPATVRAPSTIIDETMWLSVFVGFIRAIGQSARSRNPANS